MLTYHLLLRVLLLPEGEKLGYYRLSSWSIVAFTAFKPILYRGYSSKAYKMVDK